MAQFIFQNSESVKWLQADSFLLEPTSMGESQSLHWDLPGVWRAGGRWWQSSTSLATCLESRVQSPLSSAIEDFPKLTTEKTTVVHLNQLLRAMHVSGSFTSWSFKLDYLFIYLIYLLADLLIQVLTIYPWLALNSLCKASLRLTERDPSTCLSLQSARMKGVCHCAWWDFYLFIKISIMGSTHAMTHMWKSVNYFME